MKSVRYGRFTGEDFGLNTEDLLKALADFFLNSGFDNPYMRFSEFNQHTLEDLKRALENAILNGEMFDPERAEQIRKQLENMSGEEIDQLLNRLVQKLVDEATSIPSRRMAAPAARAMARLRSRLPTRASTSWATRR